MGTFLLRLGDLEAPLGEGGKDAAWRVDSHQLLQKYAPLGPHRPSGGVRRYAPTHSVSPPPLPSLASPTRRGATQYTGWYCLDGGEFIQLELAAPPRPPHRRPGPAPAAPPEALHLRYPLDAEIQAAFAAYGLPRPVAIGGRPSFRGLQARREAAS